MASYNYYNTAPPAERQDGRLNVNSPLPPLPSQSPERPRLDTSPGRRSPFSDEPYSYNSRPEYGPQHSQQSLGDDSSYHGAASRMPDSQSYADDIPLQPHPSKASLGSADSPQRYEAGTQIHSPAKKAGFANFLGGGKKRTAWFCYTLAVIQIGVFIGEIIRNSILTGSPIQIHPNFNPMIGPSPYVQINMGARFVPCMRNTEGVQDSAVAIAWPCPNTTTTDPNSGSMQCQLSDLCGFSGVPNPKVGGSIDDKPQPNQWFRFIVPMFLHAGIIHIGFNMLLQLTLGKEMETIIGPVRFALVYFSSGIFGFVMGGNFAASGIASTGASGCLFGILALTLLDLLYHWSQRPSPVKDLMFIMLDVVISFVLGLLPGLDNFSHIGGFLMGLVLGVCILHSPNKLRERIGETEPSYVHETTFEPMRGQFGSQQDSTAGTKSFVKQPVGFFKGRKPLWWAWWFLRVGALVGVFVGFIVLLNNFYKYRDQCKWCKYLSCLPIKNWCDLGNLHITNTNTTSKRSIFDDMPTSGLSRTLF